MGKSIIWVIFLLFFIAAAFAQEDLSCTSDIDCLFIFGDGSVCDIETAQCLPPEGDLLVQKSSPAAGGTPVISLDTEKVEASLSSLQSQLDSLSAKVSAMETEDLNLQIKLSGIESSLNSISKTLEELKKKDIKTVSTGLASLQKNLENASSEITVLQEDVVSSSKKINFWNVFWIVLIVLALAGIVLYFMQRKGKINPGDFKNFFQPKPQISRDIHGFITQQIRIGKKFSQIKEELLKTGWSLPEIEWAYKETTRKNYQEYLQKKPSAEVSAGKFVGQKFSARPSAITSQNKVMVISLITVVLIVAGVFFLATASGKAIYLQKLIAGTKNATAGEISYTLQCTPPHILNPEKEGCCLDTNKNAVCDYTEKEKNQTQFEIMDEGKPCLDNRQCDPGLCINSQCSYLSKLYKMKLDDCSKVCNYYSAEFLTSDGEAYNLKPLEGSYTGAGALSWKLLTAPNHCKEEAAILPVKTVKNKPGQVISEEIIALSKGQSSKVITHPYAPKLAFSLTVKYIYELCADDENDLYQLMVKQKQLKTPIQVLE